MFGVKMVGGDVMYSLGSSSHSPWLFMLGIAYLPLVSSWICPPAVFESLAVSTLVMLLVDLRFYPPLLVSFRLRWCLSWSRVERLLLYFRHVVVLGLHASGAEVLNFHLLFIS
jgi:hypothetical protein